MAAPNPIDQPFIGFAILLKIESFLRTCVLNFFTKHYDARIEYTYDTTGKRNYSYDWVEASSRAHVFKNGGHTRAKTQLAASAPHCKAQHPQLRCQPRLVRQTVRTTCTATTPTRQSPAPATKNGLMYFRARYYDLATGEFISKDSFEYGDGMSFYRGYLNAGKVDPDGGRARPPSFYGEQKTDVTTRGGTYTHGDLKGCLTRLSLLGSGTAIFSKLGCASVLLNDFLDKKGKDWACPAACKKALRESGLPPKDCLKSYLSGHLWGNCKNQRIGFNIYGHHIFEGFKSKNCVLQDLSFAFHQVRYDALGACSTSNCTTTGCCCNCDVTCTFRLNVYDKFDFCPGNPAADKFSIANCACALGKDLHGQL